VVQQNVGEGSANGTRECFFIGPQVRATCDLEDKIRGSAVMRASTGYTIGPDVATSGGGARASWDGSIAVLGDELALPTRELLNIVNTVYAVVFVRVRKTTLMVAVGISTTSQKQFCTYRRRRSFARGMGRRVCVAGLHPPRGWWLIDESHGRRMATSAGWHTQVLIAVVCFRVEGAIAMQLHLFLHGKGSGASPHS